MIRVLGYLFLFSFTVFTWAIEFSDIPPVFDKQASITGLDKRIERVLSHFSTELYVRCHDGNKQADSLCGRGSVARATDIATARVLKGLPIDEFRRRLVLSDTNQFGLYGSSTHVFTCHRAGDYDFSAINYLRVLYTAIQSPGLRYQGGESQRKDSHWYLSDNERKKLIFQLLPTDGDVYYQRFGCKIMGTDVHLLDTENHILMINVARYLNNQLIYRCPDYFKEAALCPVWHNDQKFNNNRSDSSKNYNQSLAELLRSYLIHHYEEYNSRPYQGFTTLALAVLQQFAEDKNIRELATMNLDYLSTLMAVQSNGLRRHTPYRRQPKYENKTTSWEGDNEVERYTVLSGNYHYLYDLRFNTPGGDGMNHMILTAAASAAVALNNGQGYRMAPDTLDLMLEKSSTPIYQQMRHTNTEIYSATGSYLLTAGGHYDEQEPPASKDIRKIGPLGDLIADEVNKKDGDQQDGWAKPTSLMPTAEKSSDYQQYVRFVGHVDRKQRQNTCVAPDFACGIGLAVPQAITQCLEEKVRDWYFYDLSRCSLNYGFHLAIYAKRCQSERCLQTVPTWADHFGFMEVRTVTEIAYSQFKASILAANANRSFNSEGLHSYKTTRGDSIVFEINPQPGRASILSLNRHLFNPDFTAWPPARGNAIGSTELGRVTLDNPMLNRREILVTDNVMNPYRLNGAPAKVVKSTSLGGMGGGYFDDSHYVLAGNKIEWVELRTGSRLDAIAYRLSNGLEFRHGGNGGGVKKMYLAAGEYLVEARISAAVERIHSLYLKANTGREIGGGSVQGNERIIRAPAGSQIVGFYGRKGGEIDQLGVVLAPIEAQGEKPAIKDIIYSQAYGGSGGVIFDDGNILSVNDSVSRVEITSGERIDGIVTVYQGGRRSEHGRVAGHHVLNLDAGEYLQKAYISTVRHGVKQRRRVSSLRILTNHGRYINGGHNRGEVEIIAPEGWQIAGFHGRAGIEIDDLGVILTPIPVNVAQ